MGYIQSSDDFFTYENRLASFIKTNPISRRRGSNANLKAPKSLKWPHKFLSPSELAKSGFYYLPSLTSPDNVVCFLCHKPLDGWEETDDPFVEHLRHSPNCGWAITASIERAKGEWSEEHPLSTKIIEARKATFADKWPHEEKKGWKCHIKQMIEAGWRYTPTLQSDDTVTCNYCALTLNNWEKNDNPSSDKHYESSPDCPFFALIKNYNSSHQIRNISPKRTRASWMSRLSVRSNLTTCSTGSREASFPVEERDSILTIGSTSSHKMPQERKRSQVQSRRLRLRKNEAVEATIQDEIIEKDQNLSCGRKRISEESHLLGEKIIDKAPKRRAARHRPGKGTDYVTSEVTASSQPTIKSHQNKASSTLKGSLVKATTPINDSDIEQVLEADLNRSMSEDETSQNEHSREILKSNYSINHTETDDASEVEVCVREESIKPYPKLRVTRSTSSSGQKTTHKEVDDPKSSQIENQSFRLNSTAEQDHNISGSYSSPPVAQTKKGRASTRKAVRKLPSRNTRSSAISSNSHNSSMTVNYSEEIVAEPQDSTERKSTKHSTPIKSILSSKHSQNEDNEKRYNEKNSNKNLKGNVMALDILETKALTQELISCDEEHEQDLYIESDLIEKKLDVANSMDFKDNSGFNALVGTTQSKDSTSNRRSNGRSLTNSSSKRNIQETAKTVSPENDRSVSCSPKSIMVSSKTSTPRRREATPQSSPPCSDAENQPPSLKHSMSSRNITTPPAIRRVIIIDGTPIRSSPSKRPLLVGLQTDQPWKTVDPEKIFSRSPISNSNTPDIATNDSSSIRNGNTDLMISGNPLEQAIQRGGLTSMEEKMTVEEWIYHNALVAEESLKRECERMVSKFEREGTRAIRALEGVRCVE